MKIKYLEELQKRGEKIGEKRGKREILQLQLDTRLGAAAWRFRPGAETRR